MRKSITTIGWDQTYPIQAKDKEQKEVNVFKHREG